MRPIVPIPTRVLSWLLILLGPPALAQDSPPAKSEKAETKPAEPAEAKKAARPVEPATVPTTRPGNWLRQHEGYVEQANKGKIDLLFIGDSITANWRGVPELWDRRFAPRHAANFGIGGDRTQHVLWRLEHGEAEGIKPKVVVLLIGTNNIGSNPEAEVVAGVRAVVDSLRSKLPESKILLLGLFPRRQGPDRDKSLASVPPDPRVGQINTQLATFDDGKSVRYLDIGKVFLDEAGQVPRTAMPDFLHLTPTSYAKWADAIEPTLAAMLDEK